MFVIKTIKICHLALVNLVKMHWKWSMFTVIFFIDIDNTTTLLSRVDISDDEQPLCLDGTRYAYGLRPVIELHLISKLQDIRLKLAAVLCRAMGVGRLDGSFICREARGAVPRTSVKIVVILLLGQVVAGRISKKRQG